MSNHYNLFRRRCIASFTLCLCVTFLATQSTQAQNIYPFTGDALIHGQTVGTGAGSAGGDTTNAVLGLHALSSNTNGNGNIAIGWNALRTNTVGVNNVAVGMFSLRNNTWGIYNTGVGWSSLSSNTTGYSNTAFGAQTMMDNTTGFSNVAVGHYALEWNTTGNTNTALGNGALVYNTTGYSNVAVGVNALINNATASNLVAVGDSSLFNNTAANNTALGSKTLFTNTTGFGNTAAGYQALYSNQGGQYNAASGWEALYSNTSGTENVADGVIALYSNTTGNYNTSNGLGSMYLNTSGSSNAAFGVEALINNTTGSYNTGLGAFSGPTSGTLTNTTAIGYNAATSVSNSVAIGNSSVTSIGGYANWTNFSDGRYKKNINKNVPGLVFINKLVPITYTLDIDGIEATRQKAATGAKSTSGTALPNLSDDPVRKQASKEKSAIVYTGFVAQDVEKAARAIGYDFSGVDKPKNDQQSFYGLRYSDFVVPLVKAVQELSAANDSLQQVNAQLSQRLDRIEQLMGLKTSALQNASTLPLSSARLFQNSPNPFAQSTLINYYLPENAGSASIRITGMNGETIKSIAVTGSGAGQLSVQTAQLASGTYTYSLYVDGILIDTKKMVLVR
jgi:hypothetical protein